ncbi:Protein MAIN-LIKE 1 [Glycine soja]
MVIMVRTRGLPRSLGRGIGRGRGGQDEHHPDDVPRRSRPTASVHRQQVRVAEEVVDMTENVPPMTTDVPAAGVEGLVANDVATGSVVDDAVVGFPGGPRDPSMLTSFPDHVAHNIWTREERPHLKLASQAYIRPHFEGLVAATRLSPLIGCSVVTDDPRLIYALVERWHGETNNFHLPVGELTITLDDVEEVEEVIILLMELLEVLGQEARAETAQARGTYVRLSWVWDIYLSRCEARRWIVVARAYLLHLVGCTLFANKSATHVHVVHLEAFRDLGESGRYA